MSKYGSASLARASAAPLGLLYVVLLIGALSGTMGQPPDFHQAEVSIQGRLAFKDSHNGDQEWSLEALGADEPAAYLLPGQPRDSITGQALKPGSWVALSCDLLQPDPVTNICTAVSGTYAMAAAAPVVSYSVTLRVLVMVLGLEGPGCSYAPGADVDDVQRAFTARPGGYFDFFSNCSYGSVTLDPSAFRVIAANIPCSRAQVESCMSTAMAPLAKRVARKVLGEETYSQYNRFVYVMPKGMDPFCNWVGQAELPGTQSWYMPDRTGIFEQGTVMQEILHNFGVWHGWRDEVEYQDYSSAMGLGNSCPSAPELSRLGWASPLAVLDSSSLPANTPVNVTLPATCLGPTANHLRIRPDWMGEAHVKNVYLALRSRCGGDLTLLDEFHNRVSVHELDRAIDDSFTSSGDPRVQLVQVAGLGSRRLLPAYKLIVYPKVFLPGPRMTVEVCRWQRRATDCPTFWVGGRRRPLAAPSAPSGPQQHGAHPPAPAYAGPWYGV